MQGAVAFRYVRDVDFRNDRYGPEIGRILALAGEGTRALPLVRTTCGLAGAQESVKRLEASPAVRAGLYLYLSCWDEAHSTADSVENPDGYFWHAIVHRQEPDAGNSAYWFRRTGKHPVFPRLAAQARECGYGTGGAWDPFEFIDFCESARKQPGSKEERAAIMVQRLEWQLLFDHCARSSAS